jgi:Kef-type K+ transport system membrane component KefB
VSLLTSLLLLIVSSRLLGRLFQRVRQPSIVGEILAGVILGPAILGVVRPSAALEGISELAVFLVVLSAGLEMNFRDVASILRQGRGLVVALLSFVLPLSSGLLVGVVFGMDVMRTVFLGLCVAITALPVAVRILESFRLLDSDIARYSVAAAVLNDVAALLALGVILNLPSVRSFPDVSLSILVTGGKLVLLGALIVGFNELLEQLHRRGVRLEIVPEKLILAFGSEALLGIVIVFVLLFGSISDTLGFHFVIGAFFGALLIDRKFFLASRYDELARTLASITGGFLAPVFFAYIGLEFDVAGMRAPLFVSAVLAASIGSKLLAGWLGGRLVGMRPTDALGLGIILNGRGVMELVVASIAFQRGFIGQGLFSTLVLMGVVTTLVTPLLFQRFVMPHLAGAPEERGIVSPDEVSAAASGG